MTTMTFDTLKFANRLKDAGVISAHAEAEAQALAEVFEANIEKNAEKFATKENHQALEDRVDSKFELLRKDIHDLRKDMFSIEGGLRKDMFSIEERFNGKLEKMTLQMTVRLGGIVVAGVGALMVFSTFS